MDDDVMDGVPGAIAVSGQCVEQLEVWIKSHPEGLDDPETLPGFVVIVAQETERAFRARCWKWLRKVGECKQ